jgi:hypothetical protein
MKQFLDDSKLKGMTVPTVRLSHHKTQLRRVLVSRASQKANSKRLVLQGAINFMRKQNVIVGASIAGMLAIIVLTFSVIGSSKEASALQLAQNTSQTLAGMTPQEAEYKKFYPYFVDWMRQAQKAPDLRVLSYDELVKAYPEAAQQSPTAGEPLRIIDDPSDGTSPKVHELKYLEFTVNDSDATSKVIVGINSHNVPEAALTHAIEPGKPRVGA